MFITLYEIDEMHFCLLGTNGFHVKAENERLTAAGLRCRQNVEYENITWSFAGLRQKITPKSARTCSTIIFPHSITQIIDLWRCRCHCSHHFLNSLYKHQRRHRHKSKFDWLNEGKIIVLHVRHAL